ncbi:MAG: hypothetical protein HY911_09035 [Desulfobacterales bacterium]|nr:hypothetical protein [Desulfobacterales bacterium]
MDELLVGMIAPVQNYQKQRDGKPLSPKRIIKEKRKNRADRRQSVRSGIVVTLSDPKERRRGDDRRKK